MIPTEKADELLLRVVCEEKGRITNDQTRFPTFLARGGCGGQLQHDNNVRTQKENGIVLCS